MANANVNEKQVDLDFEQIERIREIAWQRDPATLLALTERMQVQLITDNVPRRRRRMHRAIIDYFEDVLEERIEKDVKADGDEIRRTAGAYLRNLLKSLDP